MRIILFYLRILVARSLTWKNVAIFSMIALTIFYLIGYVDDLHIHPDRISQLHSFGIVFIAVIASASFFPIYVPRVEIVKNHFPVSAAKKYLIEAIVNCFNFRTILILFIITLIGISTCSIVAILNMVIFSCSILLIEQNLKVVFEAIRKKNSLINVVFNLLLAFISVRYTLQYIDHSFLLLITASSLISSLILHVICRSLQNMSRLETQLDSIKVLNLTDIYLRVLYRNKSILSYTGLWLLFVKLLFLPAYFNEFRNLGGSFEDDALAIITAVLLTVVPIFTYIFNNLWGFLRNAFLTLSTRVEPSRNTIQLYVTALIPFILIDLAYNLTYVYLADKLTYSYLLFYFAELLFALLIGLVCSSLRPAKVIKSDSFFNFKTHTFLLGNIVVLCSAFVLSYLYMTSQHFTLISLGVIFFSASLVSLFLKYSYRTTKSTTEKLILT